MGGQQRGGAGGMMGGMQPNDEESKEAAGMFGSLLGTMGGGQDIGKHPRTENYWDMWKSTFCPRFTPFSFTFCIFAVNTTAYFLSLFMAATPSKELNQYVFLGADLETLHKWGALDAYEIHENFQIWRLLTSLLLSTGFSAWGVSSLALIFIGFVVESKRMSAIRMAVFYFTTGILGNLFAVCINFSCSVGNMACIMALISGMLAGVIVNFKVLAGAGHLRICLIFMTIGLFVMMLMLSANKDAPGIQWEAISMAGEGGGFIAGLCLGLVMMPFALERESPYVKCVRKIGMALTFCLTVILVCVFFFSVEPTRTIWSVI